MKRFYSERLLHVSRIAAALEQVCQAHGETVRFSSVLRRGSTLPDLKQFEEDCRDLGLLVSAAETRRLIRGVELHNLTAGDLSELAHCIVKVLESELATGHFFKIRSDYSGLLLHGPHFGEAVARQFPKAAPDIDEASACLALDRHQCCVFHSMLILEHGLRWMCKKLKIKWPAYDQWATIIDRIETELGKLPAPKAKPALRQRRDFLAGAAAHLRVVKDGWRNHVSHGRGVHYGPEAAEAIYQSVRHFLRELAEHSAT